MIYSIYFSPTGNTKKCIDEITSAWYSKIEIDLFKKDMNTISFEENDLVYFAVPSFAGRVPSVVIEKIKEIQGNKACVVPIVVYGNRAYDDTLLELKNTLEEVHFISIAAICVNAQHSIMKQYGANRPDKQDILEMHHYAKQIKEVYENKKYKAFQVPGNMPYVSIKKGILFPITSDNCIKCGLCASECPTHAIAYETLNRVNEDLCINCMHCIHICPLSAKHLDKDEVNKKAEKMAKLFAVRKKNEIFI